MTEKNPIIFFDGYCNLCNAAVQFVIKHDPTNKFYFAPLQSAIANQYLGDLEEFKNNKTFILFQENKIYSRSTAALKVAKQLSGPIKLIYGFIIVPPFIRDAVYNFISTKRYRWFGKRNSCMIPTPTIAAKFLNN